MKMRDCPSECGTVETYGVHIIGYHNLDGRNEAGYAFEYHKLLAGFKMSGTQMDRVLSHSEKLN